MLKAAQQYLDLGWSVIPIRRGDKKPAIPEWRQYQTAPAHPSTLLSWFGVEDAPNVGVVTGKVSNLAIVDFDGYEGKDPQTFLRIHHLSENAPIAITGKGFHVYYRHPGGVVRNGVRVGRLSGVGIDLRGDGGYVVAPPSIHETGREYHWLVPPAAFASEAWDVLPAPFMQTVERDEAVTPLRASDVLQANGEIGRLMCGVSEGGRNQAAATLAGFWLKVTHGDESAAWLAMQAWNALNTPSLPHRELLATFRSIASRHVAEEPDAPEGNVLDARAWAEAVRDIPPRQGVPCPSIPGIEELGGIVERDLVLLAGRPGMGKSTVAWGTVAEMGIRRKMPTVIFSTEMTAADVARWIGSYLYRVPARELSPAQWRDTLAQIAASPLTMCDQGTLTLGGIVHTVTKRPDTKLFIVDHIQRLVGSGSETRNLQLGTIAKGLKSLAKDHHCTALVLSQMSRAIETSNREPQLSDLRESGDLEQEADAVCFLWSDYDDPTADPLPVKFSWAKNRHGALSRVEAMFHKSLKYFEEQSFAGRLEAMRQENANREKLQRMLDGEAA